MRHHPSLFDAAATTPPQVPADDARLRATAQQGQPAPEPPISSPSAKKLLTIIAWNLLHGGGLRTPRIAITLAESRPDAAVLCEFRATRGGALRAVLHDHGLTHQVQLTGPKGANSMLVAARAPLADSTPRDLAPGLRGRLGAFRIEAWDLTLTAAHLPCAWSAATEPTRRAEGWQRFVSLCKKYAYESHLAIGDLNANRDEPRRGRPTLSDHGLGRIATWGYTDAMIAPGERGSRGTIEPSWHGPRGERARLDHALLSAPLAPRLRDARYLHAARAERLSDHAPLLLRLAA